MSRRVVAISKPSSLALDLCRLAIEQDGAVQATIPLEDMAVVIVDSWGVQTTTELLTACAEAGVAFIVCDARHLPSSVTLPLNGHSNHARVIREQVECSLPKKKRLWQQIVQAKVLAQATALKTCRPTKTPTVNKLQELAGRVASGDAENIEGQAAAAYFPALFGKDFERDREDPGLNAMLNYGYAVMRALVARALIGAGLHPALGVFHRGPANPFNLADDAMEPLRPLVDEHVWRLWEELGPVDGLDPSLKKRLAELTVLTVRIAGSDLDLLLGLERYAASLREGICAESRKLVIPSRSSAARFD